MNAKYVYLIAQLFAKDAFRIIAKVGHFGFLKDEIVNTPLNIPSVLRK